MREQFVQCLPHLTCSFDYHKSAHLETDVQAAELSVHEMVVNKQLMVSILLGQKIFAVQDLEQNTNDLTTRTGFFPLGDGVSLSIRTTVYPNWRIQDKAVMTHSTTWERPRSSRTSVSIVKSRIVT